MSEVVAATAVSLKTLSQELEEISNVMYDTQEKLDYVVNGNPSDKTSKQDGSPIASSITLAMVQETINVIRRRANKANSLVSKMTGN